MYSIMLPNMEQINTLTSDVGKCSFITPLPISEFCHLKLLASAIFNVKLLKLRIFHVHACVKDTRKTDQP